MADFEKVIRKHANEDGAIPAESVQSLAQAIAKYVGENFVDLARFNAKRNQVDELQEKLDAAEKLKADYDKVRTDFDKFKQEQSAKEIRSAKTEAYKNVLKSIGIPDKFHASIIKATDFDNIELVDGKLKDESAVKKKASEDWGDFAVSISESGVKTPNPPANNGAKSTMTKKEIMAISDTTERQKAIAENHELFGF